MYWQSLLLPGGGWENLPVRALELSSAVRHRQTHTHHNEGSQPLSSETQQGRFQFNGPSHLWIYCLSIAALTLLLIKGNQDITVWGVFLFFPSLLLPFSMPFLSTLEQEVG